MNTLQTESTKAFAAASVPGEAQSLLTVRAKDAANLWPHEISPYAKQSIHSSAISAEAAPGGTCKAACTAPEHRQLRQRQLARAVSACTQRKAPQTTKIVAESCASTHILRSARAVPDALHRGRQSLRACHMQPNRRNHERLHRLTEGRHTHPISVPSIRYRPSGVKYWLELAPSLQLSGCIGRQRRWRYGLRSCF